MRILERIAGGVIDLIIECVEAATDDTDTGPIKPKPLLSEYKISEYEQKLIRSDHNAHFTKAGQPMF